MDLESVEFQTTGCKSSWQEEYIKWICDFANSNGERLLIGVDDNRKSVVVKDSKKMLEDLQNKFRDILCIIPTVLKVYPDKIIIWNVGNLPKEIKVDELKKNHSSYPRNELLADVFFKAGLIEAWRRGTIKITDECIKVGLPEPEFKEEFGGFAVYFYKDIYTEEYLRKMGLNERQIKAVLYVKENGKITNSEYQDICNIKKRQATDDLIELENKLVVERIGTTGKGTYYILKEHSRGNRGTNGATKGQKNNQMPHKTLANSSNNIKEKD